MSLSICPLLLAAALGWGYLDAAAFRAVHLPNGGTLREVSFERHVASLLGTLGCNAGSCHGSFQGRGGLRLSLFGFDPEMDCVALMRGGMGRRVNSLDPDRSLIVLKASGQVPHGGGKRIDRRSWQYQVLRAWIASGCPRPGGRGRQADAHQSRRAGTPVRSAAEATGRSGVCRRQPRRHDAILRVSGAR